MNGSPTSRYAIGSNPEPPNRPVSPLEPNRSTLSGDNTTSETRSAHPDAPSSTVRLWADQAITTAEVASQLTSARDGRCPYPTHR